MKLSERVDRADLPTLGTFDPDEMVTDLDQISEERGATLRDLYVRWEKQNWSTHTLDFSQDARDWVALGGDLTERMLWVMSMFFHGEEAVTASLASWVAAAPTEEMQLFLSTQIADEARHTVFFDRFYEEVVGVRGDLNARLDWCRPRINEGFRHLFYEMLPAVGAELIAKPRDPVTYARGIALYHLVLEGTLAVPGQKYILALCRERGVLPAFRAGFTAVARDESRHVGGGVRILRDLIAMEPSCVDAVQQLVREALPWSSQVFQPPHGDFTYLTVLGYDVGELFRFALFSLEKRMRTAGVPMPRQHAIRLPRLPGTPVLPQRELTPVQQLLQPMRDQLTAEMVFQGLPMVFNAEAARGVRAIYEFVVEGSGTWHVTIADDACAVGEGPATVEPDWRLTLDTDTWIAMSVGDLVGQEAFLLGRVTLEGDTMLGSRFDGFFRPGEAAAA